jgi:hypothetical protein
MREFDFEAKKVNEDGRMHDLLAITIDEDVIYSDYRIEDLVIFSSRWHRSVRPLRDAKEAAAFDLSGAIVWVGSPRTGITNLDILR